MPRYCAVSKCKSNSSNAIVHRFPVNPQLAQIWQTNLHVEHISMNDLQKRYVVCVNHFQRSDYRNTHSKFLNKTAVPIKLQSAFNGRHSDNDETNKNSKRQQHLESNPKQQKVAENKSYENICETDEYLKAADVEEMVIDCNNQCEDNMMKSVIANDTNDTINDTLNATEMNEEGYFVYVEQDSSNELNNDTDYSLPNNNEIKNEPSDENPIIIITVPDDIITSSGGTPPVSSSTKVITNCDNDEIENSNALIKTHGKDKMTELLQLSQLDLVNRLLNANNRILELETMINNFEVERTKLLTNVKNIKEILNV